LPAPITPERLPLAWSLVGVLFGSLFPIGALLFDAFVLDSSYGSFPDILKTNPLHFIILLASLVLGATFWFIGTFQRKLHSTITELRKSEQEQWRLAHHDVLTGLGNRLKMLSEICDARTRSTGQPIILMDLNKFKALNDSYGHDFGDSVLCYFSRSLRKVMPSGTQLYRLGGDEFLAFFPGSFALEDAENAAEEMICELAEPIRIQNRVVQIGVSLGITTLQAGDLQSSDAIMRADMALYKAKSDPNSVYTTYDEEMKQEADVALNLRRSIEQGLTRNEFYIELQPIHFSQSRNLKGCEALIRWQHPTLGPIPPSVFIPIAEETGQIIGLEGFVLREACSAAMDWPEYLSVSINISVLHFQRNDFFEEVLDVLLFTQLPPHRLIIEITETLLIKDSVAINETIEKLRKKGIRISLDDFGEGFTSVKHLLTLGLDELKIDISLGRGVAESAQSQEIVAGIVKICKAKGLRTVIEGIEKDSEFYAAQNLGIDCVQGYLFSKPIKPERFLEYCWAHDHDVAAGECSFEPPQKRSGPPL
jgi:diguanylate cyclase (GGDEF)-like protein